jgi:hypothetical protein
VSWPWRGPRTPTSAASPPPACAGRAPPRGDGPQTQCGWDRTRHHPRDMTAGPPTGSPGRSP